MTAHPQDWVIVLQMVFFAHLIFNGTRLDPVLPVGMVQQCPIDADTHSMLWVRPSDIDGDGYSVEEDCDDNDVTVHDS